MGAYADSMVTNLAPQATRVTEEPLDLAIAGEGFFGVQTPQGVRYTRNGQFGTSPQGFLIDQNGNQVVGRGGGPVAVNANGTVDGRAVGVFRVDGARKEGDNYFTGAAAGQAEGQVQIGALEGSGIDPARVMVDMIASFRAYEAGQKTIQTIDDTLAQDRHAGRQRDRRLGLAASAVELDLADLDAVAARRQLRDPQQHVARLLAGAVEVDRLSAVDSRRRRHVSPGRVVDRSRHVAVGDVDLGGEAGRRRSHDHPPQHRTGRDVDRQADAGLLQVVRLVRLGAPEGRRVLVDGEGGLLGVLGRVAVGVVVARAVALEADLAQLLDLAAGADAAGALAAGARPFSPLSTTSTITAIAAITASERQQRQPLRSADAQRQRACGRAAAVF